MKNKKKLVGIFIIVLAVLLATIIGLIIWGNYKSDEIRYEDTVSKRNDPLSSSNSKWIDKQYSNIKVTDVNTAIDSLEDVKDFLGINNPKKEFVLEQIIETSFNNDTTYKLQQVYNGIPIYGKGVNVSVNTNTNYVTGLSSYYYKYISDLPKKPQITEEQAIDNLIKKYSSIDKERTVKFGLIYNITRYNEPKLLYKFGSGMALYYVDAITGNVLEPESTMSFSQINIKKNGQRDNIQNVTVEEAGENIELVNTKYISDIGSTVRIYTPTDEYHWAKDEKGAIVHGIKNAKINQSAVDAMANAPRALEYFYTVLGQKSFDNNGEDVNVYVNVTGYYGTDNKEHEFINNAFWSRVCDDDGNVTSKSVIAFSTRTGDEKEEPEYSYNLDVVAHEFAHGINNNKVGFSKDNIISRTLDEAYADIFGECIEDGLDNFSTDWQIAERNIKEPSESNNPSNMSEYDNETDDEHKNSTIISHAAYLMWNGGKNQEWTAINDTKTLARIWYISLKHLKSNSDFSDCRNAVIRSAKEFYKDKTYNFTENQLETVAKAFEAVGITDVTQSHYHKPVKSKFNLNVMDMFGEVCGNYHLKIEDGNSRAYNSQGVVFDDDVQADNFVIEKPLKNGVYELTITNLDNPKQQQTVSITVQNENQLATNEVDITTLFYNQSKEDKKTTYKDLTETELKEFEELFSLEFTMNSYYNNSFLTCLYDKPSQIKLDEVLYVGAGISKEISSTEKQELIQNYDWDNGMMHINSFKLITSDINIFLIKKTGLSIEQFDNEIEYGTYIKKYDSYYFLRGDTNLVYGMTFTSGEVSSSGEYTLKYIAEDHRYKGKNYEVKFKIIDDTLQFISNKLLLGQKNHTEELKKLTEDEVLILIKQVMGEKDSEYGTGFKLLYTTEDIIEHNGKYYYPIRCSWWVDDADIPHSSYVSHFFVLIDGTEIIGGTFIGSGTTKEYAIQDKILWQKDN